MMTHRRFGMSANQSKDRGVRGRLRRLASMVAAVGVVASGIVSTQFVVAPQLAQADDLAGCSYGVGGPHAGTICWLNFDAITTWNNEPVVINLEGGYKVSFTVNRTTNSSVMTGDKAPQARSAPTWSGSVFGKAVYVGVKGKPALYSGDGALSTYRLSNIQVLDHNNVPVNGWSVVSMNGEAQAANESITWRSDATVNELARLKNPNNGCLNEGAPPLSGTSVACVGGKAYDPIVSAVQPTWFEAAIQGGGGGDVVLGFEFASIELKEKFVNRISDLDSVDLSMTAPNGTHMGSKTVTAAAQQGTTGSQTVLPVGEFVLSEQLTSGTTMDRDNYDQTWSCVNKVTASEAPFAVTEVPIAVSAIDHRVSVSPQAGDDIVCTVTNTGKARGLSVTGHLKKYEDVNGNSIVDAGDTQTYEFTVENTGLLDLHGIVVEDAFGPLAGCPETLAAGESATCTGRTHTFDGADVTAGKIANQATASGFPPGTTEASPHAKVVSVPSNKLMVRLGTDGPHLAITNEQINLGSSPKAGSPVSYEFTVKNMGNEPVNNLSVISGAGTTTGTMGAITCDALTLASQEETTCHAQYTLTQHDIDSSSVHRESYAQGIDADGDGVTSDISAKPFTVTPVAGLAIVDQAVTPIKVTGAGDTVTYDFTIENTGNVTLTDPDIIYQDFLGSGGDPKVTCDPTEFGPAELTNCQATYVVTQADADLGTEHDRVDSPDNKVDITGTAVATAASVRGGVAPMSQPADATSFTIPHNYGITPEALPVDKIHQAGQKVSFKFQVTNDGTVTVHNLSFVGGKFFGTGSRPTVVCPTTSVAPEDTVVCEAIYTATQEDLDRGYVTFLPDAFASNEDGDYALRAAQPEDRAAEVAPAPKLNLTQSVKLDGPLRAGTRATYSFVVKNTGNLTVKDVRVIPEQFTGTGSMSDIVCGDQAKSLAPGEEVVCTATYVVTEADVAAGGVRNFASATGVLPEWVADVQGAGLDDKKVDANRTETGFPFVAEPALTMVKSADLAKTTTIGQKIGYQFLVTNTGNVALTDVAITEGRFTGAGEAVTVSCPALPAGGLLPGSQITCTGTYKVVAADLNGQLISNTATASAHYEQSTVTSAASSVTTSTATVDAKPLVKAGAAVEGVAGFAALFILLGGGMIVARKRAER